MRFKCFIILCSYVCLQSAHAHLYDRFTGKKIDDKKLKDLEDKNILKNCTIEVKPCTEHEGSRVNGTCNNMKQPVRGSALGPYLRLLEPDYAHDHGIRASKSGEPLPSARKVRTSIASTGRVIDMKEFNVAAVHLAEVVFTDMSVVNGIHDFIRYRQYCCEEEGKKDPRCIPIHVPEDDWLLHRAHVTCLNFSRAMTFQDMGCLSKEHTQPEQVNLQTPLIDLSQVYGVDEEELATIRTGHHGLLAMEIRNGRYVPLGDAGNDTCFGNDVNETTCYRFGEPLIGNFDLRTTTFLVFFMREHNRIARILQHLNPCWKDDRIFKVARQINIATLQNIFWYELMPVIMGKENMLKNDLISTHAEHINSVLDEHEVPLVYAEYFIATKYFHNFVDGRIKKYDENYHFYGEFSISDTLWHTALIEQNNTFEALNRGSFYQHAAKLDDILDPELSEKFFGKFQNASDLIAIDIQRGRDMGVRGYNDYRHLCGMPPAKRFEDLLDVMDEEKLLALKKVYKHVDDIDLYAGIFSERWLPGAYVGPVLFCIMTKQMTLIRFADRFWFERGDQYHSFTLSQLHEIRKTNMARLACDNAEGLQSIQPHAMLNVGPDNEHVPCSHISGPDLSKWLDSSCSRYYYEHHDDHSRSTEEDVNDEEERKTKKHEEIKIHEHETPHHWPHPYVKTSHDIDNKNFRHTPTTTHPPNKEHKDIHGDSKSHDLNNKQYHSTVTPTPIYFIGRTTPSTEGANNHAHHQNYKNWNHHNEHYPRISHNWESQVQHATNAPHHFNNHNVKYSGVTNQPYWHNQQVAGSHSLYNPLVPQSTRESFVGVVRGKDADLVEGILQKRPQTHPAQTSPSDAVPRQVLYHQQVHDQFLNNF